MPGGKFLVSSTSDVCASDTISSSIFQTGAVLIPLASEIADAFGDTHTSRGVIPRLPRQYFQSDGVHPNHRAQVLSMTPSAHVNAAYKTIPGVFSVPVAIDRSSSH